MTRYIHTRESFNNKECDFFNGNFKTNVGYDFYIENPLYHLVYKNVYTYIKHFDIDNILVKFYQSSQYNNFIPSQKELNDYYNNVIDRSQKNKYKKMMKNGVKFDIPFLLIDQEGTIYGHEGRHRTMAAKELGCGVIPTLIVKHISIEKRDELLKEIHPIINDIKKLTTWLKDNYLGYERDIQLTSLDIREATRLSSRLFHNESINNDLVDEYKKIMRFSDDQEEVNDKMVSYIKDLLDDFRKQKNKLDSIILSDDGESPDREKILEIVGENKYLIQYLVIISNERSIISKQNKLESLKDILKDKEEELETLKNNSDLKDDIDNDGESDITEIQKLESEISDIEKGISDIEKFFNDNTIPKDVKNINLIQQKKRKFLDNIKRLDSETKKGNIIKSI